MERLDKIISVSLNVTRSEAVRIIKKGEITVDGKTVKNSSQKIDENSCALAHLGKELKYNRYVYIMMNKPKGVISASNGRGELCVTDILPDDMKRKNLFPAGRLDIDTTGFVLITDDGELAHKILSPKNHIPKTYIAVLDKPFDNVLADEFKIGVELDGKKCLPADIKATNGDFCIAEVVIRQGMYHQIKRMFKKFGITVSELKRIKMGNLPLDENLAEGECRYLSNEEVAMLQS